MDRVPFLIEDLRNYSMLKTITGKEKFKVISDFKPTGDQPQAIQSIAEGFYSGNRHQVLKGVTGSGKTFTMACVVEQLQLPTLIYWEQIQ